MKSNIYLIRTKRRLNIKATLISTNPFEKDTIREWKTQVYRSHSRPTSFTNIKFTHKPLLSAQDYGLKLESISLFIYFKDVSLQTAPNMEYQHAECL